MAVNFGSAGAAATVGTTSLSVPYPASISAGDLLICVVVNKTTARTPGTPSGWTSQRTQTGGYPNPDGLSTAANSGWVKLTVFTKIADGTETGNLAISIPSAVVSGARMFRYTGAASYGFAFTGGSAEYGFVANNQIEVDPATPLTGIDIASGDLCLILYGSNSARIDFTGTTLTQSGNTFGAGTLRSGTNGDKFNTSPFCSLYVFERPVTAGSSTASPTVKVTNTSTAADDPCGPMLLMRIRDTGGGVVAFPTSEVYDD